MIEINTCIEKFSIFRKKKLSPSPTNLLVQEGKVVLTNIGLKHCMQNLQIEL